MQHLLEVIWLEQLRLPMPNFHFQKHKCALLFFRFNKCHFLILLPFLIQLLIIINQFLLFCYWLQHSWHIHFLSLILPSFQFQCHFVSFHLDLMMEIIIFAVVRPLIFCLQNQMGNVEKEKTNIALLKALLPLSPFFHLKSQMPSFCP